MRDSLARHILSASSSRVLRALWESPAPLGVRETADLCDLSPRGAALLLQRLVKAGLAARKSAGRLVRFSPVLTTADERLLRMIVEEAEGDTLRKAANDHSRGAKAALRWMDATLRDLRQVRERYHGPH